jgi:hypothetical protein
LKPAPKYVVSLRPRFGVRHHDLERLRQVVEVVAPVDPPVAGVAGVGASNKEITGVVRINADNAGREVGGDDEELIFESPLPLGESNVVLVQEPTAEQLVWRQAVDDHRIADAAPRDCFCEDMPRYGAPAPSHLRNHDV